MKNSYVKTKSLVGKELKIRVGPTEYKGTVYNPKKEIFSYQLLVKDKKTITGITLENRLKNKGKIFECRPSFQIIYNKNLPLPREEKNKKYYERKKFLKEHNNS